MLIVEHQRLVPIPYQLFAINFKKFRQQIMSVLFLSLPWAQPSAAE